jgi:2-amino-4-hydroxy-6-hydroxymethyldihydropteridine diphosphokinase
MQAVTAYVGVGSNLGDRIVNLRRAARLLDTSPGIRVRRRSSIYETDPVGGPEQPRYLNAVLELEAALAPRALLHRCHEIEAELGRKRTGVRNEARVIDLDLLLYGDEVIAEQQLVVPHGRLHQRSFVLAPLVEIDPKIDHPALGRRAATLLRALAAERGGDSVNRIEETW